MTRFLILRMLRALLTVALVHGFTFFALRAGTDIADQVLNWNGSAEAVAAFNERWGLDRPVWQQYLVSLGDLMRFDFGFSFRDGRPASAWVAERLPATALLSGSSFLLMIAVGIPLGILAALHRGAPTDRMTMALATVGYSLPNFVLGLALIYCFSVWLQWLPSSGSGSWRHMILPVIVAASGGAAALARFARSAMLDVMGQPYILAARAAGVPPREIVLRHALPNAAIPLVTFIGFAFGATVGGAIVVETVFAWPGMGLALSEAVGGGDLAIVQTMVILFALVMVLANLLVDIAYGFLNPKIRLVSHDG